MTYDPTVIDLLAHQVLNCVCAALDQTADLVDGQPGCPCRVAVTPGEPALVVCGTDCKDDPLRQGQLYVNVERVFRTTNFPAQNTALLDCGAFTYAVELLVTLVRCTPLAPRGAPPRTDALQTVASIVNTDKLTVLQAIQCCVPEDPLRPKKRRVAIVEQRRLGPNGTVVGSVTRFIADLNWSCGCPPEES